MTINELKNKRNALAVLCMELQDQLFEDCDNAELRLDYEDAESEYQYLCQLIERRMSL